MEQIAALETSIKDLEKGVLEVTDQRKADQVRRAEALAVEAASEEVSHKPRSLVVLAKALGLKVWRVDLAELARALAKVELVDSHRAWGLAILPPASEGLEDNNLAIPPDLEEALELKSSLRPFSARILVAQWRPAIHSVRIQLRQALEAWAEAQRASANQAASKAAVAYSHKTLKINLEAKVARLHLANSAAKAQMRPNSSLSIQNNRFSA